MCKAKNFPYLFSQIVKYCLLASLETVVRVLNNESFVKLTCLVLTVVGLVVVVVYNAIVTIK